MTVNQNPEQIARDTIDRKLIESGFAVQDRKHIDWKVSPGIAVREYPTDALPADYVLFVDRVPVGVIEAKKEEYGEKTNLDIFWLKDKSLADLDNLPDPDVLANEIVENIEAALESFREIADIVSGNGNGKQ